jgi:hypothetical protein
MWWDSHLHPRKAAVFGHHPLFHCLSLLWDPGLHFISSSSIRRPAPTLFFLEAAVRKRNEQLRS